MNLPTTCPARSGAKKRHVSGKPGQRPDTRHVSGKPGQLYGTAVGVFILSMPNRYLPILQEGKIESLKKDSNAP